jgi:purine-nucleoside phosphorylase
MSILSYDKVAADAAEIERRLKSRPEIGLILGTGLSPVAQNIEVDFELGYGELPFMPPSTNPFHPGNFVFGRLFGKSVACMSGRLHTYEGYGADEVAFPVFLMRMLGARQLVVTNAAGAINEGLRPGQLCLISDHINFTGKSPLPFGLDDRLGQPCPDMSYAYHPRLREAFRRAALDLGVELGEGVYAGVLGPSFETPAEIRAFRALGADLVGMSTIPEIIAAASCGLEAVGISLVTNMAAGVVEGRISIDDINSIDEAATFDLARLLEAAFKAW